MLRWQTCMYMLGQPTTKNNHTFTELAQYIPVHLRKAKKFVKAVIRFTKVCKSEGLLR